MLHRKNSNLLPSKCEVFFLISVCQLMEKYQLFGFHPDYLWSWPQFSPYKSFMSFLIIILFFKNDVLWLPQLMHFCPFFRIPLKNKTSHQQQKTNKTCKQNTRKSSYTTFFLNFSQHIFIRILLSPYTINLQYFYLIIDISGTQFIKDCDTNNSSHLYAELHSSLKQTTTSYVPRHRHLLYEQA